ncbi:MAG: FeoB-associated Cys-rich membrane protein [Clostridiales bacterium]|nr:FeoB-associated Cys-rich membrane protein [Clostridiales bacterium]
MNFATFVVGAVLVLIVFLIIRSLVKKGGNTCGCDRAHCHNACHKPAPNNEQKE